MDVLTTLKENGVPVPLRLWCIAGGYTLQDLITELRASTKDEEELQKVNEMRKERLGNDAEQEDDGLGFNADAVTSPSFEIGGVKIEWYSRSNWFRKS